MIYFWHRSSPRYLEPWYDVSVLLNDPPNDVAGMTKVVLDVRGRLLEFQAVPPQVKDKTAQPSEPDWATLFAEAGLDIRNYRQTESNWTPPFFADAHMSWEGPHVDHAEIPVRIEAAAYQGKPVYFQIVAPWDKPLRQEETVWSSQRRVAAAIAVLVILSVIIAAVFLARRNLRQGRSDTKGAFKISIFVFLMGLAGNLLIADHIPDLTKEIPLLFKMAGYSLLGADDWIDLSRARTLRPPALAEFDNFLEPSVGWRLARPDGRARHSCGRHVRAWSYCWGLPNGFVAHLDWRQGCAKRRFENFIS